MIELMIVMLVVSYMCDELVLVLWGVAPIPRDRYGTQGQNHIVLLQESEASAGVHLWNVIIGIECCRITTLVEQWSND